MDRNACNRAPIQPDRIRCIGGQSFAFLPHRFLREGFLCSMKADEQRLYLFLVMAGDRNGLSFYHYDRICAVLEMVIDDYVEARNGLLAKDLIAFDGSRFQVLSLPPKPVYTSPCSAPLESDNDSATIRGTILASLAEASRRGSR